MNLRPVQPALAAALVTVIAQLQERAAWDGLIEVAPKTDHEHNARRRLGLEEESDE